MKLIGLDQENTTVQTFMARSLLGGGGIWEGGEADSRSTLRRK